jgi:hypothetical protein
MVGALTRLLVDQRWGQQPVPGRRSRSAFTARSARRSAPAGGARRRRAGSAQCPSTRLVRFWAHEQLAVVGGRTFHSALVEPSGVGVRHVAQPGPHGGRRAVQSLGDSPETCADHLGAVRTAHRELGRQQDLGARAVSASRAPRSDGQPHTAHAAHASGAAVPVQRWQLIVPARKARSARCGHDTTITEDDHRSCQGSLPANAYRGRQVRVAHADHHPLAVSVVPSIQIRASRRRPGSRATRPWRRQVGSPAQ